MSKSRNLLITSAMAATLAAGPALAEKFGLGRPALPEEVAAWDLDILPDGTGLPDGSGDVWTGEEVFAEACAVCHGDFAEGRGNWPKLAGGEGTLADKDPLKTVGSYWPYLSTTWDYVNRSMPFGDAQSLSADEVYAIVAYILYSNDLVDDDFTLSKETFLDVEMPNADGFIVDDRATAEYPIFNNACMENCKDSVEITMRAAVLDVTPEDETDPEEGGSTNVGLTAEEPAAEAAVMEALDMELVAAGEKVFRKCKSCHAVGEGAKNKTGPALNNIIGAAAGSVDGFKYSKPMLAAAEGGLVWSEEEMAAFLAAPKKYMKGTRMSFAGLKKEADIDAVLEFLKSNGS